MTDSDAWSPEWLEAYRERQRLNRRRGLDPIPIVGTANARDKKWTDQIPVLVEAVAGPGLVERCAKEGAKKRVRTTKHATPYFQRLTALLRPHGIPDPTPEFLFAPPRKWRADFCFEKPVALMIEIDGGLFVNGGHNRGAALLAQYEKQNAATLLGYRVLRYGPDQLHQAARDIRAVFNR